MYTAILIGSIAVLAYLYFKNKKGITEEFLIALLISYVWVKLSGVYVGYTQLNHVFLGVNLFPWLAWTTGLVILREVYERVKWKDKFWKVSLLFIALVIALEYIGYNYWGIQLVTNYPGLLGYELMHMPWFGKLYYLTIGPIYLKLTDYFGVK